jgi:uncharacterized membrane protein (DUF2068 family)
MRHTRQPGPRGFRVVGAMKLASGLLAVAAGFGLFRLMNKDIGTAVDHFIGRLHLDPDNYLVHEVVTRLSGLKPSRLKQLAAGTFFYATLHLIEGTGLILRQRWAGYLTVVMTSSLLPIELYEIYQKQSAVRISVLLVNLAIVIYLIVKLRQEDQARGRVPNDESRL